MAVEVAQGRLTARAEPHQVDPELIEPEVIAEPVLDAVAHAAAERLGIPGAAVLGDFECGKGLLEHDTCASMRAWVG